MLLATEIVILFIRMSTFAGAGTKTVGQSISVNNDELPDYLFANVKLESGVIEIGDPYLKLHLKSRNFVFTTGLKFNLTTEGSVIFEGLSKPPTTVTLTSTHIEINYFFGWVSNFGGWKKQLDYLDGNAIGVNILYN